ncbi:hypothetical protein ACFPN7_33310 [Amycolatopsis halotolerans]
MRRESVSYWRARGGRTATVMATHEAAHEWGAPVDVNVPSLS